MSDNHYPTSDAWAPNTGELVARQHPEGSSNWQSQQEYQAWQTSAYQPRQQPQQGYYYGLVAQPVSFAVAGPHGVEATTGIPYSDKSKTVAGLLQIFLGGLGVGRFYKGDVGIGILQILASFIFGLGILWGFIDGIAMLAGRPIDKQGRPLHS